MKILDATAGMRGIWYQKNHPYVVFADMRKGKFYQDTPSQYRVITINPNILCNWRWLPFIDDRFDMVVFDPPHIICENGKKPPAFTAKYGMFYKENWREMISFGAAELFRVLKDDGTFILKWCENDITADEVLKCIPYSPLFGTRTGQSNKTHWICFIKHRLERTLEDFMEDAQG